MYLRIKIVFILLYFLSFVFDKTKLRLREFGIFERINMINYNIILCQDYYFFHYNHDNQRLLTIKRLVLGITYLADDILIFFLIFPRKQFLAFHTNCLQRI